MTIEGLRRRAALTAAVVLLVSGCGVASTRGDEFSGPFYAYVSVR